MRRLWIKLVAKLELVGLNPSAFQSRPLLCEQAYANSWLAVL